MTDASSTPSLPSTRPLALVSAHAVQVDLATRDGVE